jgi:hypothetical protein
VTPEWNDWRAGWFRRMRSVRQARGRGVFARLRAHVLAEARRDPEDCGIPLDVDNRNFAAAAVCERLREGDAGYRVSEVDSRPRVAVPARAARG